MAFVNLLAAELLSRVGSWPLDDLTDWRYLSQKEHQYLYVLMYINVQWKNIEAACKHWKQAVANCRLGDAESPRRAFFRRCYSGALQIVVVSDNLWKLHLRTTTLEESALKSVGAKPGKAVGHIGKKRWWHVEIVCWKGSDMDWRAACLSWTNTCILIPGVWEQVK